MKKRLFCIFLTLAMTVELLIGCSQSGVSNNQTKTPSTDADNAETVSLKFTYWGSTYEKESMEKAVAAFMQQNPHIKIEAQHIPADYDTKLAAMVAGNEAPDVAYLRDFMALPYAAEGKLLNILDMIDADPDISREDFLDKAFVYWEPGKACGLFTAIEVFGLYYNKKAFEAAGVPPLPTKEEDALTWDGLVEIAKKLTIDQNGNTPNDSGFDHSKIKQYGLRFDYIHTNYMPLVVANGGDYINKEGTAFGLTDPKAYEVIQKMADAVNVYHVSPSPAEAKSIPAGAVSLISQQAAIFLGGQWNLLDLAGSGMEFGVGILPKGEAGFASGAPQGTFSIFASTKHPKEAYQFWKFLANPESCKDLYQKGLWMPLMKKWYEEPLVSEWADTLPAHPEGYRDSHIPMATKYFTCNASAYVKDFNQINAIVQPVIERIFFGEGTAEELLKEIEPEVNKLIKGRYTQ